MTTGLLYVVATPIGNLNDITLRALTVLKSVDVIAAEDTRHTAGLLTHFGIQKKCVAVHQHNEQQAAQMIVQTLQAGESVALVSDAGTPAVSDPGAVVVAKVREAGLNVTPIPGANAAIAALSASGITTNGFTFIGFLPASSGARKKTLTALLNHAVTLIFYEAPHRVLESVAAMVAIFGAERGLVIARELSKTYETFFKGSLGEALAWLSGDANQQRGEFVLLLAPAAVEAKAAIGTEEKRVLEVLLQDLPLKQAVKLAVDITGIKKNILYPYALTLKND